MPCPLTGSLPPPQVPLRLSLAAYECKDTSPFLIQLGTIGKHFLCGYDAINKLTKEVNWGDIITKGVGIGALTGGITLLGGAIVGLIGSLLGGGPDPTQIILKHIEKLQEQIHTLRKEMHEGFYQIAKTQGQMFKQILKGLDHLSIQVHESSLATRISLQADFSELKNSLASLARLAIETDKENLLIELTKQTEQVKDWTSGRGAGNPAKAIPQLSNELHHWIRAHAHHSMLNGSILWYEWFKNNNLNAHFLKTYIRSPNENSSLLSLEANCFLGFLGEYANYIVSDYQASEATQPVRRTLLKHPNTLPNAMVLYKALESFISLNYTHPLHDNDPHNASLAETEAIINRSLQALDTLNTSDDLWKALLEDYKKKCQNTDKVIADLLDAEGERLIRDRNVIYDANEDQIHRMHSLPKQNALSQFDILSSNPETLIDHFLQRRINQLDDADIVTLAQMQSPAHHIRYQGFTGNQLSKKPIYQQLQANGNVGIASILAECYLGFTSASAAQTEELTGYTWGDNFHIQAVMTPFRENRGTIAYNPVPQHPIYNKEGVEIKKVCDIPEDNHHIRNIPFYPFNNLGVGEKAKPLEKPINLELSFREAQWTFPIDIQITINTQTISVIRLPFTENWENAPDTLAKCWTYQSNMKFVYYRENYFACYGTPHDTCMPFFYENMIETLKTRYNENNPTMTCPTRLLLSPQQTNESKDRIFNFLLGKRREIARALLTDQANGVSQQYIAQFKNALDELDISALFLRWFAIIAGKSIGGSVLETLYTSQEVMSELRQYIDPATTHTDLTIPMISAKAKADAPLITLETIKTLAAIPTSKLPNQHPRAILNQALGRLKLYHQWKKLFHIEFPDLKDAALEEHDLKCQLHRETIFQEETLALLNEIKEQTYTKARFIAQNHMRYADKFKAQDFSKIFDVICLWGIERSLSPSAVGLSIDGIGDIESIKTQQWLFTTNKRRWFSNMGGLVKLATHQGKLNFDQLKPANLVMWGDGLISLLKLIYNDDLKTAVDKAGYTTQGYLTAIDDFIKIGIDVKSIIYKIGTSSELYETLFSHYFQKLNSLSKWISKLIENYRDQAIAFREFKLATKNYSKRKLDDVCAAGLMLKNFILMLLPSDIHYPPEITELLDFMDRDELMNFLSETHGRSYKKLSITDRLNAHCEKIKALEAWVSESIKTSRKVYVFWNYLQHYFKNKKANNLLVLQEELINGLTVAPHRKITLNLLHQFLSLHPQINSIELEGMRLNQKNLSLINELFVAHPQLKRLTLRSCSSVMNIYEPLSKHLNPIKKIHFIKTLSNSELAKLQSRLPNSRLLITEPRLHTKSTSKIPPYYLTLELPIGSSALTRLFHIAQLAKKVMTRRLLIERSSQHADNIEREIHKDEALSIIELQGDIGLLKTEVGEIVSTYSLFSTKNPHTKKPDSSIPRKPTKS